MDGHVDPTSESFALFKDLPRDRPIHMLNLVRLRARAAYGDGRAASGLEAYRAYARESGPVFRRLGGTQVWLGRPELTLIGPATECWDIAFIAQYPTGQAFIDMLRDADYRQAVAHRTAAVANSRLVRLAPATPGQTFGDEG